MLHPIIRQPYTKTILLACALLVLLSASTAMENAARVNAQASANFRFSISDFRLQDPMGNPQSAIENRKSASTTISYTYDNAGRLTQANYGGKTIAYTYDNAGNLTQRQAVGGGGLYLPMIMR